MTSSTRAETSFTRCCSESEVRQIPRRPVNELRIRGTPANQVPVWFGPDIRLNDQPVEPKRMSGPPHRLICHIRGRDATGDACPQAHALVLPSSAAVPPA